MLASPCAAAGLKGCEALFETVSEMIPCRAGARVDASQRQPPPLDLAGQSDAEAGGVGGVAPELTAGRVSGTGFVVCGRPGPDGLR